MNKKLKFTFLIIGSVLFTFLFWHQSIGLNAIIFTVFLIPTLMMFFRESIKSTPAIILYSGALISSVVIFIHASALSIFVWISSLFLLQSFVHYNELKTLLYGGLSGFVEYLTSFTLIPENIEKSSKVSKGSRKFFKIIRFIIIPLLVFFIFLWIYRVAVPEFDNLVGRILKGIGDWFAKIFEDFSFDIIFIFIWGVATMGWFYYKKKQNTLIPEEAKYKDNIAKKSRKDPFNLVLPRGLKPLLKYENTTGLILIISVNVLLLMVNIIDITTIWFGFEYSEGFNLKQFVHEGTYLLILSILLSMGIMLFFFRRNLNFYSKSKALKYTSFFWIFQNAVLLTSVIIRNLHYIDHFALAYLRIGLFFFLFLVVIGLITLSMKIKNNKSLFYLLKTNTWALYIAFVLFSIPDWDMIIAKYNFKNYPKAFVEASFMLSLDEKTLPLLDKHKEILDQPENLNTYKRYLSDYKTEYEKKVNKFTMLFREKSLLSINLADLKAFIYYKEKTFTDFEE